MQYLLLIYRNEAQQSQMAPADYEKLLAEYSTYTQSIVQSGHFKAGDGLQPTSTATTVRVRDGKSVVLDGPYADAKEQLGGYYLVDVPTIDEAIAWALRCPAAKYGTIDVRPVMPNGRD